MSPPRTPTDTPRDPAIGVVVVTRDRRPVLERAIASVAEQKPGPEKHLLVIDNASTDDTPAWTGQTLPDLHASSFASIRTVRLPRNAGGCGGFNAGFRDFLRTHQSPDEPIRLDAIWLMDDDAEADPGALDAMWNRLKSDQQIAAVGACTTDLRDRSTKLESTIYFDETGAQFVDQRPDSRTDPGVDVVSACCQLIRVSALEQLGVWDDRFFLYCDDADWCIRARRAGYQLVSEPDAVVYHAPWHSKLTPEREYYFARNMLLLIANNRDGSARRRLLRACLRRGLGLVTRRVARRNLRGASFAVLAMRDGLRGTGGELDPRRAGDGSRPTRARTLLGAIPLLAALVWPGGAPGPHTSLPG